MELRPAFGGNLYNIPVLGSQGDGGSPMVCEQNGVWKVVGMVSWGIGCGTPGVPGVYVNMAKFRPWVETVLANAGIASK